MSRNFIYTPEELQTFSSKLTGASVYIEHVSVENAVGKVSIIALLATLIVLFSFEGQTILSNPFLVAYLAAPNLAHYAVMITWTYILGYFLGWKYETAINTTLIGSSSHFEVAIAVATTLYGITSPQALATVIGPLMEVPLMLSLVKLGLRTRKYFPRKKSPNTRGLGPQVIA